MNQDQDVPREASNTSQKELEAMLESWITMEVPLIFRLRGGDTIEGKLLYYTRYEYGVQTGKRSPAIVIQKNTIESVERK